MQIGRWGNSLAIRLPTAVVDALQLEERDEVQIEVLDDGRLTVSRDRRREEALKRLEALKRPFPPGFKFNRDEANER